MKLVVSGSEMSKLDENTIRNAGMPSLVLMERAALAVYRHIKDGAYHTENILILIGSGNNGGDGVAVARLLHQHGYKVTVYEVFKDAKYSDDLKTQIAIARYYGVPFYTDCLEADLYPPDLKNYSLVVDAIFGVGLKRDITGSCHKLILALNKSERDVIGIDIPSGLSSDTGRVMGCVVKCRTTVTLAYVKTGLLLLKGREACGNLITADIGIYAIDHKRTKSVIEDSDLKQLFKRDDFGNKGTYGKVLIIAGSSEVGGALLLSAKAALASGAGMVKAFTHERNRDYLLNALPEAMITTYTEDFDTERIRECLSGDLMWADVVVIGPGLSRGDTAYSIFWNLMQTKLEKQIVIDADGIHLLKRYLKSNPFPKLPIALTPHMGELSSLLDIEVSVLKDSLIDSLTSFINKYPSVLVAKDAATVTMLSADDIYFNTSGNSALSTAGSGDVLAGMLGGYLAQHRLPDIVPLVVYLHGKLGERASLRTSRQAVTATDLIWELKRAPALDE